jgi:hypothetical protein
MGWHLDHGPRHDDQNKSALGVPYVDRAGRLDIRQARAVSQPPRSDAIGFSRRADAERM